MSNRLDDLKSALTGRYEIDKEIGQGGMATVYLARDVKHNRQVAVKVLRPDLAAALGHERFLREIEIAANLTHPHILPLYDSGEAEGFLYYVMPYIKGDTLRDRIEKEGELPVSEAVRVIREVTDALAFAHSQGVVHRDVKPDNVMLSGRHAMVTDFGVAKAVSEATGRSTLTTAGVALGTPTYMAPEQATADPHVDHRADIYAVGVMAYELLAGRTPFQGASPQAVLAAHVTQEADPLTKHRDQVSVELEAVVMKCLAKKPADRWQSAEEMLPLLETMTTSSGGLTPTATRPVPAMAVARPKRVLWMGVGAVAAVAVLAVFGARMMRDDPLRVTVASVRQVTHSPTMDIFPDISDDGREIVYAAGQGLSYHVYVRDVEGGPALGLTDDRPGLQWLPRWSPSGREVRFFELNSPAPGDLGSVLEISKFGGQARQLPAGLQFESAGVELHLEHQDSLTVRAPGGGEVLAVLAFPNQDITWAAPSPDGSRVAYVRKNAQYYSPELLGNDVPTSIWVTGLDEWVAVRVTPDEHLDADPTWLGNDRLLFVSNRDGQRDIYLVPLRDSGEPAGEPIRVTTGADVHTLSVTPDGSRVAYSKLRFRSNLYEIVLPEQGSVSIGSARPVTRESAVIEQHGRSTDGQVLVYDSNIRGQQDIYLMPTQGGEPRRITTDPGQDMDPELSPDGSEVAFYSTRNGTRDIYVIGVDGQNEIRLSGSETDGWAADEQEIFPAYSPDGLHIAFSASRDREAFYRLMVLSRDSVGGAWTSARQVADSVAVTFTWTVDNQQLVYIHAAQELRRVSIAGDGESVVALDGMLQVEWPYTAPGGTLFFRGMSVDGNRGIYVLGQGERMPRLVVRFDDPGIEIANLGMTVRGNSLILTVSEKESDIYVMELEY
jgi:Tol biopolymer transport system component/tRNA A-37 threonylcarbamoyl transferase component Bud32